METQISCTGCGLKLDINEIVYAQIADQIKKDLVNKTLSEKKDFEEKIRKQFLEEKETEIGSYKLEIQRKSEEVKELNKTKAELERLKREKDELRSTIEVESEKRITELVNSEKERLHREYDEKNNLKLYEKEHLIDSLKNQIQILTRKAEQGGLSNQLQGEVQELAIEEYLQSTFPLDQIVEIRKGVRGADCVQIVNSRDKANCGNILYESKRTQSWSAGWITKFKADMLLKNALFGVIVTEVYPPEVSSMSFIEGIWICNMREFRGLCYVLRESVLLLASAKTSQENKGEKMQMLYDYLTGNEFRMQIETVIEGFALMQEDLISEKRSMEGIWKRRQKQIDKVLLNTTHMFSSIKGIAGNAVPDLRVLELSNDKLKLD